MSRLIVLLIFVIVKENSNTESVKKLYANYLQGNIVVYH